MSKLIEGTHFVVTFSTGNDAFLSPYEVNAVLERLANKMREGISPGASGTVQDTNGNTIGSWHWRLPAP